MLRRYGPDSILAFLTLQIPVRPAFLNSCTNSALAASRSGVINISLAPGKISSACFVSSTARAVSISSVITRPAILADAQALLDFLAAYAAAFGVCAVVDDVGACRVVRGGGYVVFHREFSLTLFLDTQHD